MPNGLSDADLEDIAHQNVPDNAHLGLENWKEIYFFNLTSKEMHATHAISLHHELSREAAEKDDRMTGAEGLSFRPGAGGMDDGEGGDGEGGDDGEGGAGFDPSSSIRSGHQGDERQSQAPMTPERANMISSQREYVDADDSGA